MVDKLMNGKGWLPPKIIELGMLIIIGLVGYWAADMRATVAKLDRMVSEFRVEVAKTYVSRQEFNTGLDKIYDRLKTIDQKLDNIIRDQR